jgi:hypothetical protein
MLHEAMEYRFSITEVLSSKVVIGRRPYAHGNILRHVIVVLLTATGIDQLETIAMIAWATLPILQGEA